MCPEAQDSPVGYVVPSKRSFPRLRIGREALFFLVAAELEQMHERSAVLLEGANRFLDKRCRQMQSL